MSKVVILNEDQIIGQASKPSRANNILSHFIADNGIAKKSETNYTDGTKSIKTDKGKFETLIIKSGGGTLPI